jgi:16S rRNA G966 N2-methylase RsmD
MNERKTENFIRNHFSKFPRIIIEEQKSENPRIDKFLKTASKKGGGRGYPEFIIQIKDLADFIIVVECKADIKKHQSSTLDKYHEYAVDGALLYASFLSKEFDVLAIAVSGENKNEVKISHFLHLKKTIKSEAIFSNKLLDIDSYINGYIKSPIKRRQDYESLLIFSKTLNDDLQAHNILESQRGLLISCILIALENKVFRKSYKDYEKPDDLSNTLVDTVAIQLKPYIQAPKLELLKIQFSFIRSDTTLTTDATYLKELIEKIDLNINMFIKTHEYFDFLGQLYIEFLRYANSDSSLGIVLTPPHITELFSDLAQVNKNSIVYDNCAGTGGFLISAMSKMIMDCKGDEIKEKKIKEKQLIGVEYQAHIFALACTNMYIHKDGKTNIIHGDCFNEAIMKQVKQFKPNIGLLNPPYKTKNSPHEEFEFVLNCLDVLEPGGTCVSITPISCMLADKGVLYELKKRLLEKHTLEAVLSMPQELFHNSDRTVVTAIIVVTSKKPHPKNKETYFGYWKDDGFVKRKNKGRIDVYGRWEAIKSEWIESFLNRKTKSGLSINKLVTAKDEWCAEAYMSTDYSKVTEPDFIEALKNYAIFNIRNN